MRPLGSFILGSKSYHNNSLEHIILDPNSSFSSISGHSQDNQNSHSIKRAQGQSKNLMTWPQKSKPTSPHPNKNNPLSQKSRLVSPKVPQMFLREYISLRPLLKNSRKGWSKALINKRLRRGILMKVTNTMGKKNNLLMLLARIMRTWLKSESLKISNMMLKY